MRRFQKLSAIPLICLVAACANTGSGFSPLVENPGPNYSNDLAYCQSIAASQGPLDRNTGAAAATGAALAGGTTAVFNNKGTNARDAALIGAAAGVAGGALQQQQNKESIIRNCLRSRGYVVLN